MRIVKCRKHKARKQYDYYAGTISEGDVYFRGFAVTITNLPFEFMFTDRKFYDEGKIPFKLLIEELKLDYNKRRSKRKNAK